MKIDFREATKKNISIQSKADDNYIVIDMNIHIEREYYVKIQQICKRLNISFGEFLNDALGEYYTMNSYDFELERKRIEMLFPPFNTEKKQKKG